VSVIGICVSPSGIAGKTSASVVVASGTRSASKLEDCFTIKTPASENSEKVVELARAVSSKLTGVAFTDIVIRTTDYFAGRGASGGSLGAHCEGALVALLRERIDRPVMMLTGKLIAVALGMPKEQAEAAGKQLAPGHAKAGAAALSALPQ
jgi:hypothetical protein